MSSDLTHIESLLNVAEKCADRGGKLSSIGAWAISELQAINAEMKTAAVQKTKADAPVIEQPKGTAEAAIDPEDDHSVDPDLGAPRAIPATELGSTNGRRL